jgi:hypothetical protein
MEMLSRLFSDHRTTAIAAAAILVVATVLPFAKRRFPGVLRRLFAALFTLVTTPFMLWRRSITFLAAKSPRRPTGAGGERPFLTRRLLPVLHGLLVLGGIFILTVGMLSGLRSSGIHGNGGQRRTMLEAELVFLVQTLEDTRVGIGMLDREWELALARYAKEHRRWSVTPLDNLEKEKAALAGLLSHDPSTSEVFRELNKIPAAVGSNADIILSLEAFHPASALMEEKKGLLLRYHTICRAPEELSGTINTPPEAPARTFFQPEYGRLLRLRTELPPAIGRVESGLNVPDGDRRFDPMAFLGALYPSLIIFCAFVWAFGCLIESLGTILNPVAGGPGPKKGGSTAIDAAGTLIWAE